MSPPTVPELFRAVFKKVVKATGAASKERKGLSSGSTSSLASTLVASFDDEYAYDSGSEDEDSSQPDDPTAAANSSPEECENTECYGTTGLSWCHICGIVVCEGCWDKQAAHRKNKHPKTELKLRDMVKLLQSVSPPQDEDERKQLHKKNHNTKWFGVTTENEVLLNTTARFSEIYISNGIQKDQYPALVSFVGETGAGKSSLITSLLKLTNHHQSRAYDLPIAGSTADSTKPTSSDVHLYADPSTCHPASKRPVLYADCEGFGGGNNPPIAADKDVRKTDSGSRSKARCMSWARSGDHSRSWMVEHFYPMILYTFSDVICYVTRNIRKHEEVLNSLVQWASKVFEASTNQPLLPYAIIIVNVYTEQADESKLMELLHLEIPEITELKSQQNFWREKGKRVETFLDLVLCYYCAIDIVCIPPVAGVDGVPTRIKTQFEKLRETISRATEKTSQLRRDKGALIGGEHLDFHFRRAFTHFSENHYKEAFNFLDTENQFEGGFGTSDSHIVKAATRLMSNNKYSDYNLLFAGLEPFLASSILLDARRKNFPLDLGVLLLQYQQPCEAAKTTFFKNHCPCSYRDAKGNRCVNMIIGHDKGHQLSNGTVVKAGKHESGGMDYGVMDMFSELLNNISRGIYCTRTAVVQRHREILARADYAHMWSPCNTTCLACLFSVPVHVLPCGHILCDACIDDFSDLSHDACTRTIRHCPLCPAGRQRVPWTLKRGPRQAAPRILTLDGGGIRAIMQLKILSAMEKAIEELIGVHMPVQGFFDLVLGTSAGGIVALGLTVGGMTVEKCTEMFIKFAIEAFKKRSLMNMPGLRLLVEASHHGQYKSTGLNASLLEAFGKKPMFGECNGTGGKSTKVAVTMVSSALDPLIIANYNRNPGTGVAGDKQKYEFLRAEKKDEEMAVWEAARATSAAPRYFKPFHHKSSGRIFIDGALLHNNPVWVATAESTLLWPEHPHPDLVFSIGTGCQSLRGRNSGVELDELVMNRGFTAYIKRLKAIIAHQTEMNMNPQEAWDQYMKQPSIDSKLLDKRFARLNVEVVQELPKLDQVEKMEDLVEQAVNFCVKYSEKIKSLSARLIASLFYLQLDTMEPVEGDKLHCKGTIRCRLAPNSPPLAKLRQRFGNLGTIFWIETGPENLKPLSRPSDTGLVDDKGAFAFPTQFTVPSAVDQSVRVYMSTWNSCRPAIALISGFPYTIAEMRTVLLSTAEEMAVPGAAEFPSEAWNTTPDMAKCAVFPRSHALSVPSTAPSLPALPDAIANNCEEENHSPSRLAVVTRGPPRIFRLQRRTISSGLSGRKRFL